MKKLFIRALVATAILIAALIASLFLYAVYGRGTAWEVPVHMALYGEGGWTHHVGEAEMTLGDERVVYDVYAGDVKFNDTYYVTGLMLMARRPMPRALKYVQLPKLICCRDDMRATNMQMIRLPFLPNPTICPQIVSLEPGGKCQTFKSMDISVTNGVQRYVCRFEEWIKDDRELVLSFPDDLFRFARLTR